MSKGNVPKGCESLLERLKIAYRAIKGLVLHTQCDKVSDIFNSKLECVGFVSGSTALMLERDGMIENKGTSKGDNCYVLTNDCYLLEIKNHQNMLIQTK